MKLAPRPYRVGPNHGTRPGRKFPPAAPPRPVHRPPGPIHVLPAEEGGGVFDPARQPRLPVAGIGPGRPVTAEPRQPRSPIGPGRRVQ